MMRLSILHFERDTMNIVILGAGKTGRGFLPRLLGNADITFIDKDKALTEKLKAAKSYEIGFFSDREPVVLSGYSCFHTEEEGALRALKECFAVFVSVRGENTPAAADWLKDKIAPATHLIACENATLPSSLMGVLKDRSLSAAVFCTTVKNGSLNIKSEDYPALHVDAQGLPKELAELPGIKPESDFPLLMLRKIYTYNAAAAIISYLGAKKEIRVFAEAATHPEIEAALNEYYPEINRAISARFGVDPEEQQKFSEASRIKFQSFEIEDSVERNAASPERKLGPAERIIAPAKLILEQGGNPRALVKTAKAALDFMGVQTAPEARDALISLSRLDPKEELFKLIMEEYAHA